MVNLYIGKLLAIALAGPLGIPYGTPVAGEVNSNNCKALIAELNRSLEFSTADPPGFLRKMHISGDMFRVQKSRDPERYCTYAGSWIEETIEVPLHNIVSILEIENTRVREDYVSLPIKIVGISRRKVTYCNGSVSHGDGPSSQITLFLGEDAYPHVYERFEALLVHGRSCLGA